ALRATFPKSRLNILTPRFFGLPLAASLATRRVQIVTQNLSALHHEFHALKFCDIGQRIPTYGHEIGEFPALDRTDGAIPSHHLRIHDGRSANNLGWSHPELDHVFEFLDLSTVGKRSHSSPETNFDAGGDGAAEAWFRLFGHRTNAILFGDVVPF